MGFKRSRKPLLKGNRGKRCPNWWEYRGKPKAADACVYRASSRPKHRISAWPWCNLIAWSEVRGKRRHHLSRAWQSMVAVCWMEVKPSTES